MFSLLLVLSTVGEPRLVPFGTSFESLAACNQQAREEIKKFNVQTATCIASADKIRQHHVKSVKGE